ncbi:ABC transporter ATP-binding protein [Methylobacterium organophilum]|uniref:Nitrate import ATP-binding protein NrtC n=1 Tax=Methylobacterium organophilum TaxID=410 RepID=A0ABQ4T4F8_METOR|nr:ABC transporter ATP-binding protein [Methylobacterium organophilum]GJE26508.1 Nitrate import ATP-binding protein NrtC [Methylobacterium organophilum]
MVAATRNTAAGARLRVESVSHAFALRGQALPVLDRVGLDLPPGGFVALLGPSGCGKSTLLRLIAGLEPPGEGRITVDGSLVEGPDPSRLLVFQDPTLYPWRTVRGNVALGLEARGTARQEQGRISAALDLVGLSGFADAYPHQLSGGMAQRAALARALVNEPRLLLLDEPLGKLDALTRLAMQAEILRLWQEKRFSAVLVTHDVEEALVLAERVIVLSDRPAALRAEIPVTAPYPRHRDDPELVRLRREILAILGQPA